MLAGAELEAKLRASVEAGRLAGVGGEWLNAEEVERLVPVTAGGTFVGAAYGPDDGVADIAALLDAFLRAARARGAQVLSGARLVAVDTKDGVVTAVRTEREAIATPAIVNAAGAWAPEIGRLAGAAPLPLRSLKRHIMVTSPLPWVNKSWPSVWDLSHEVYFRPEPPGLLLSPCDADESSPDAEAVNDPGALESLATKLAHWLPRLAGVSVASTFAGLRTFTPDGNMLLGADPRLRGFFWCAGLGGNGMTLCPALGRIVAEAVLGQAPAAEHAPARFAS
jgi:glycine/D-amino acid oxidase-like deaminating enzyme